MRLKQLHAQSPFLFSLYFGIYSFSFKKKNVAVSQLQHIDNNVILLAVQDKSEVQGLTARQSRLQNLIACK